MELDAPEHYSRHRSVTIKLWVHSEQNTAKIQESHILNTQQKTDNVQTSVQCKFVLVAAPTRAIFQTLQTETNVSIYIIFLHKGSKSFFLTTIIHTTSNIFHAMDSFGMPLLTEQFNL